MKSVVRPCNLPDSSPSCSPSMKNPPTEPSKKHDPYAALRLSSFRRYFTGHTILILGWQMQKVAVGYEIFIRTDSAFHLGYVGLAQFAPFALLAVFAGHVTDTHNRKHILIAAATLNSMAAAGLAWNSLYGTANLTYAFLVLGGCARAFQMPARRSFLPRIVPREKFPNAVMWHSSGFELSTMAGPALGGLLIGIFESAMPIFALDILQVGPQGLGFLMSAPAVGAFCMALLQVHMKPAQKAGRRLLIAVTGFGLVTIIFGLSQGFALSLAMLCLLGACDNVSVVIRGVLVQLLTPDKMRGRVSAIDGLFIGTSNELGAFESGMVAGLFTPVISVVTGGIGTIIVVAMVAWAWPQLRRYGALDSPGPE